MLRNSFLVIFAISLLSHLSCANEYVYETEDAIVVEGKAVHLMYFKLWDEFSTGPSDHWTPGARLSIEYTKKQTNDNDNNNNNIVTDGYR